MDTTYPSVHFVQKKRDRGLSLLPPFTLPSYKAIQQQIQLHFPVGVGSHSEVLWTRSPEQHHFLVLVFGEEGSEKDSPNPKIKPIFSSRLTRSLRSRPLLYFARCVCTQYDSDVFCLHWKGTLQSPCLDLYSTSSSKASFHLCS